MDYDLTHNSADTGKRYVRGLLMDHFGVVASPIADGDAEAERELDYQIADKILSSADKSFTVTDIVRPAPYSMDQFNAGQHGYMEHIINVVNELKALAGKQSTTEYKF